MRSRKGTVCSLGVVVAFVWALAMPSARLWGQTVQGVITGTVFDASRRVVPNAAVKITNEGTNISQALTTGGDGSYRFALVPPGTYTATTKRRLAAAKSTPSP